MLPVDIVDIWCIRLRCQSVPRLERNRLGLRYGKHGGRRGAPAAAGVPRGGDTGGRGLHLRAIARAFVLACQQLVLFGDVEKLRASLSELRRLGQFAQARGFASAKGSDLLGVLRIGHNCAPACGPLHALVQGTWARATAIVRMPSSDAVVSMRDEAPLCGERACFCHATGGRARRSPGSRRHARSRNQSIGGRSRFGHASLARRQSARAIKPRAPRPSRRSAATRCAPARRGRGLRPRRAAAPPGRS